MARIRTIKPEFWQDESLSDLPIETHAFAAGLLNHCDDEGYFNANPKLIGVQIFPLRDEYRNSTVHLQHLSNLGFIKLSKGTDGKVYGHVVNFLKHQVINKPKASKIKDLIDVPYEYGIDTVSVPTGTGNREQGIDIESSFHSDSISKPPKNKKSKFIRGKDDDNPYPLLTAEDFTKADLVAPCEMTYTDYMLVLARFPATTHALPGEDIDPTDMLDDLYCARRDNSVLKMGIPEDYYHSSMKQSIEWLRNGEGSTRKYKNFISHLRNWVSRGWDGAKTRGVTRAYEEDKPFFRNNETIAFFSKSGHKQPFKRP